MIRSPLPTSPTLTKSHWVDIRWLPPHSIRANWQSREFLLRQTFPGLKVIRKVWIFLRSQETPTGIYKIARACGLRRKASNSAVHWLVRKELTQSSIDNFDRRRSLFVAAGDFSKTSWDDYHADYEESFSALKELRDLWNISAASIPNSILEIFES